MRYVGVARIFDWGGETNPQITRNDLIKFFEKRKFLRDKDTVEWKIRSRNLGWHVTWVLLKKKT